MVSYLASAETVLDFLLFDETAVQHDKLLAMTVCVIFLPANTFGRKENHRDSLGRKHFLPRPLAGRKASCQHLWQEGESHRQSWQEAFPAKTFDRKQNHENSLGRKPFFVDSCLVGSNWWWTFLVEAKYDEQSP